MKKKNIRWYIWAPVIAVAILIAMLISGTKVYPDKTIEILIGLLTFSGTVFLGIITLYQNYIFKTYAEDNDKNKGNKT